jgi:hypothetical protein
MNMTKDVGGTLRVYDPTADGMEGQDDLATRFNTLDGKVVGLLNNTKDRSDIVLDQLERQLRAQFPGIDIRHYRKQSVSGMTPDIKDRLTDEVDALITAAAD